MIVEKDNIAPSNLKVEFFVLRPCQGCDREGQAVSAWEWVGLECLETPAAHNLCLGGHRDSWNILKQTTDRAVTDRQELRAPKDVAGMRCEDKGVCTASLNGLRSGIL